MAARGGAIYLSAERLASLSDTMFGVAMTLVVGTLLPSIQTAKGPVLGMLPEIGGELVTLVLSFTIAARYWISQHQRLAMSGVVTPLQTWLHLAFLFLIVLIPISTSLPNLSGAAAARDSVAIYGAHLLLIALVNLLLWIGVHRTTAAHGQIVRASLAVGMLLVALGVGAWRPSLAMYAWFATMASGRAGPAITRWVYGR